MGFMKRQSLVPKKKRGPPPTGQGIQIQVRIQPDKLAELDRWIAAQTDQPSRPEAIRRIVERTLARSSRPRAPNKKKAQKALELAGRAVERIVDKSMPTQEQERRKRALIKGPKEFRNIRGDLPESET
jgi:metal-responsive CopG/Arc/MetJ family transcriptional regulator